LASSQSCPPAGLATAHGNYEEIIIRIMPAPLDVTVGVDTHKDIHVAVAIDGLGRRLGQTDVSVSSSGYVELLDWSQRFGSVTAFGVEGTGSYGAGLARYLRAQGANVIEVNRPDRATRHRIGKSDPIDAEAAARTILAGTSTITPKDGDGHVEMIRILKIARDSAVKAQSQATNQVKALIITAPPDLRESIQDLPRIALLERCAALRTGSISTPLAATKHALRLLSRRALALRIEAKALSAQLSALTAAACPALLEITGIGPDTAAALLITAGDNPDRLRSEAAFAALCGTNPIPASSGKTSRHRLNRGGDRQANAALHRAIVTRMHWDEPTKQYVEKRTAEGKTKPEIMRCLKRYLARQVYHCLVPTPAVKTAPRNLEQGLKAA